MKIDKLTDQKHSDDLKGRLEEELGRTANPSEIENIRTDALALARYAIDCISDLESRLAQAEGDIVELKKKK